MPKRKQKPANRNSALKRERKFMEERGFEYLGTADDFEMPRWMECAWRRVGCGKDECRICGRIKQDRLRHTMRGEDPDSAESIMEDVGSTFRETLAMVRKHAEAMGIDITNIEDIEEPPEPEAFPFYRRVSAWQKTITAVAAYAEARGSPWLVTEAGQDLLWYKNTFLAKVYRQLSNRWHMDRGDGYGEFDFRYTGRVLADCIRILEGALAELSQSGSPGRQRFTLARYQLRRIAKEIQKI